MWVCVCVFKHVYVTANSDKLDLPFWGILSQACSMSIRLINRTPTGCFRQAIQLVVDPPLGGGICGRPKNAHQVLTGRSHDALTCPLAHYISKLDSYGIPSSISWYKVSLSLARH